MFDFRQLIKIVESMFITEALTKGSQNIMTNKKLVAGLADAIRDDAMFNASSFPAGFAKTAQKAKDEELATWFLEQLDKIEAEGYAGKVYSRDGVNSAWIVNRYIAGSHNWEDILGTLNMNLLKFYTLKNRNLLDDNHKDLQQFKSAKELGRYMVTHYSQQLEDLEKQLAAAARKKATVAAKVVDNEDYVVRIILNRNAACTYGSGANWCTANTNSDFHYNSYSSKAVLFQLYPKEPDEVNKIKGGRPITGPERYQFDAGGPNFMDLADDPVPPRVVAEKFPFLGTDLVNGLTHVKDQLQTIINDAAVNPALKDNRDSVVKPYNIDDEIKKLQGMFNRGYFTDKVRPVAPEEETPQLPT